MRLAVLGPLQVSRDGRVWSSGGPKERRLLAILLLHLGEVVSTDALAEALWNGAPPPSAVKTVQVYVTRLRAALAPCDPDGNLIQRVGRGYRLAVQLDAVDAFAFVRLVREARRALDAGAAREAERHLVEAFALWRGEPYGEFADGAVFAAEVQRLTETRLAGIEVRLAAGLALGRNTDVVADAQALCADYPLHEQFWVHLVTALYRCGRQADALAALRQVRTLLADEIGADPGTELRALEQRVLRHDRTLAAPAPVPPAPLPPGLDPAGRPFFGRADVLDWLHSAWDEAERDGGRLLVIAGPAGSGRTRLVAEFAARLHAQGIAVTSGEFGTGLAVFDDLDEASAAKLAVGVHDGPTMCVATYDPGTATPGLRRALLATLHEDRVLAPLDADDIARIVAWVTGPVEAALAEEITLAAQGRPGEAWRLATRLVEERSARRVVAAVEQARPASRALAAAREEVASGVLDLARIRTGHTGATGRADWIACPYKGLASYERDDAPLFYGREELVARLCARLVDTPFVAVVGPSGAGKSSLVRAGLLPALAAGVLPGLADAPQHVLVARAPLPELDGPAVVVVDQLEEVFTGVSDESGRQRYLDDLTALAVRPDTRTVVTLRGDFVGACASHARLARLLGDGTVLVGPMSPEEIGRAVELPARRVGLRVEPALVDAVVADMRDAPDALPLMSTALVEVWQGRAGGMLSAAAYEHAGGLPGSLTRLGEAALARLDEDARAAARRLLLRLAETGEGGVLVRRRVPRRELGDDPATERALHALIDRRLLTAGDTGVEVTHEALLTHWPRLAAWLSEDEQGRALRRHLGPAAADWDAAGRPDSELYRGARLASALDWLAERDDRLAELTHVERDFLTASRDYADRQLTEETARADREARDRERLTAALEAASASDRRAQAHRLGALALVTPDLDRSLLLAVQAVRTHDDWETRGDLLAVLGRSPQALRHVRAGDHKIGTLEHLALTPDGSTLVATRGVSGGSVFTWDAASLATTAPPVSLGQRAEAVTPGPDPSGVMISVAVDYTTREQALISWDTRTRRTLATYALPAGLEGSTRRSAVAADGHVVAVSTLVPPLLLLYDRATGALLARLVLPGPVGDVWTAGSWLVTALTDTATAMFVDPVGGRIARNLPLPFMGNVVVDPNGATLLVFTPGRAALIDAEDGRVIRGFTGATHGGAVAAFSWDGELLAIGGDDHLIGVWDVVTGELHDTLRGHAAPVRGLAFSRDGRTLYSAGRDNSVIAWDVEGRSAFAARPDREPALPAPDTTADHQLVNITAPLVTWSRDRRRVYVNSSGGGAAALIEVASGTAVTCATPQGEVHQSFVDKADPDRQAMFGSDADGALVRYDLRTGAVTHTVPVQPPLQLGAFALSGDGQVLAVETERLSPDGQLLSSDVTIRDAATLLVRRRLPALAHWPLAMWLNSDGSLLAATADQDDHVELWDTRTGQQRWRVDIGYRAGLAIAQPPDERSLLIGTFDGGVVLLDVDAGRVLARHTLPLPAQIWSADFAPDGAVVALGGNDGQVHLLTGDTLRGIGQLPIGTGATWALAAFSSDGSLLSAVDERGRLARWDTRPESWLRRACSVVGRDLTPAEWETYLPGVPRQHTSTAD